jgi:hypothetical protein
VRWGGQAAQEGARPSLRPRPAVALGAATSTAFAPAVRFGGVTHGAVASGARRRAAGGGSRVRNPPGDPRQGAPNAFERS